MGFGTFDADDIAIPNISVMVPEALFSDILELLRD